MRLDDFDWSQRGNGILSTNKRQQPALSEGLSPLVEGIMDIVGLVSYDKPKLHEITDYKRAYDTLCENVYAIGRRLIDVEQQEAQGKHDTNIDDNPFSND